jgi:hypothetical protein
MGGEGNGQGWEMVRAEIREGRCGNVTPSTATPTYKKKTTVISNNIYYKCVTK